MTSPTASKGIARGKPADYDQELVKRRFRITSALTDFQNKTVLDFGSGNGAQTVQFLHSGCRILAVDIDYGDLHVLREYLDGNNTDAISPVQYDGNLLPVQNSSIDTVISYEVIEHVGSESQALKELYRVLKPGGTLIMSVPNKWWVFETHGANLPLLPWNRVPFFSWLPKSIHSKYARARIYRRKEIESLLTAHSFEVLKTQYITAPLDMIGNRSIQNFFRSTIFSGDTCTVPMLSTSILLHCRKK